GGSVVLPPVGELAPELPDAGGAREQDEELAGEAFGLGEASREDQQLELEPAGLDRERILGPELLEKIAGCFKPSLGKRLGEIPAQDLDEGTAIPTLVERAHPRSAPARGGWGVKSSAPARAPAEARRRPLGSCARK